jgi:phosphohistidine phosphatase
MEVYILRHAIAIAHGSLNYPNDDRPLTEEGVEKMKKAAKGIAELVPHLDVILTSPLERARHTAQITAEALSCEANVKTCKELLPGTPAAALVESLRGVRAKERLMLVGHEPDLGLFASSLLGARGSVIQFRKGSLCRIDVDKIPPSKSGVLVWHLTPKQLRSIAKK